MNTIAIPQMKNLSSQNSAKNGIKKASAPPAGNGSVALGPNGKPSPTRTMKDPIKLLLVDDHPIVRKGVASCLAKESNLLVIGEAANGQEAIQKVRALNPDIVLMDVDMAEM